MGEASPESLGVLHVFMMCCVNDMFERYMRWVRASGIKAVGHRSFVGLFSGESSLSASLKTIVWKRRVVAKVCGCCLDLMAERECVLETENLEGAEGEDDALVSDHDTGRASDYDEYDVKEFLGRRWCEELHEFEYLVRWTDPAYPDEYMAESMIYHTRTFRNYAAHLDAQDTAAAAAAELESSFQRRVREAGDAIRRGEVSAGPEGRVCVDCKKAWTLRHTCKKTGKKYKKD